MENRIHDDSPLRLVMIGGVAGNYHLLTHFLVLIMDTGLQVEAPLQHVLDASMSNVILQFLKGKQMFLLRLAGCPIISKERSQIEVGWCKPPLSIFERPWHLTSELDMRCYRLIVSRKKSKLPI
jgi:hypothetical protein